MYGISFIWMILFSALFSAVSTTASLPDNQFTIYTVKSDYTYQKYEPSSGIYLGAYVLQDEYIQKDMRAFNTLTGKNHASFFRYVGYGKPFPTEWVEQCKSIGAVPHIAWEPNNGLEEVVDNEYLRSFAKASNEAEIPIFLRYASEMNGTWTEYSGAPGQYIEKWRLVHGVMKEEAPNVMMVWTVLTVPDNTIEKFYPGDAYVDWVGVNIYNVVYHNNRLDVPGHHEDPLDLLTFVYNTYSYKKPIQISEYGVTNYTVTDDKHYPDFAKSKIERLYGQLPTLYPRVKSIFYFDVNNLINAPEGRKINNYAITENSEILNTYKEIISTPHYRSVLVKENLSPGEELLSYRGYTFIHKKRAFADLDFFTNYLELQLLEQSSEEVVLSDGNKLHAFPILIREVPKGYWDANFSVRGLSLRDVADAFGYQVDFVKHTNSVYIIK